MVVISTQRRTVRSGFLGTVGYAEAQELQMEIQKSVKAGTGEEHLLLLEHPPVFTLGRNAEAHDVVADPGWLKDRGIEVYESDRGGQVTYHGPGQLVGYPILDLAPDRKDVRKYIQDLERVLTATLADFGIEAEARPAPEIGVWVGQQKIASLGVHLSRWVTTHGFALNVATQLDHFGGIVACGLQEVRLTSMAELLPVAPRVPEVSRVVSGHFARVFGRHLVSLEGRV